MNLYDISTEYSVQAEEIMSMDIDDETLQDTLESMQGDFNDKAVAIATVIKNMKLDISAIDVELDRIKQRRTVLNNRAVRLGSYLSDCMARCEIPQVKSLLFNINLRVNPPSVSITNQSLIPKEFIMKSEVETIDKTKIKAAGGCPGAEVITNKTRLDIK